MNLDYVKMDIKAKINIYKIKLKNELVSLKYAIDGELDKLDEKGEDYTPSNEVGIVSGNTVDNLLGKISELKKLQQLLDDVDTI